MGRVPLSDACRGRGIGIALQHMIDTSKRRFWQIHLSTAVVLMFVAGALLYCNVRRPSGYLKTYGWPETAYLNRSTAYYNWETNLPGTHSVTHFYWGNAAVDVLVAAAILIASVVVCECLVRRRERSRLP